MTNLVKLFNTFDILSDFGVYFDRPFLKYDRLLKDIHPYSIINKEDKRIIVHNVVGFDKEHLTVDLKQNMHQEYIEIKGEITNNITGKTDKIESRFNVDGDTIENIEWYVSNGILYIELINKQPKKSSISVKYKE